MAAGDVKAGIEVGEDFAADYTFDDLGSAPGVPTNYGGVVLKYDDPKTLLIGGQANSSAAKIYQIGLERGCAGQIIGFVGEATVYADSPFIDGGLTYGPDNVLFYTTFSNNTIGQIKPGSTGPDKIIDLSALGVASSTGTLQFVPDGINGAGRLKILSYSSSNWYDCTIEPDGNGTFDITNVTFVTNIGGGPEGLVFIESGSPQFDTDSAIVSEYGSGSVVAWEIDANGDPVPETRRVMLSGLSGAEGATIDAGTGDFVFSTFGGGNRVVIIRGFAVPCSADLNQSGAVDVNDLLTMLAAWGNECTAEDINGDGIVDVEDLLSLLSQWGSC